MEAQSGLDLIRTVLAHDNRQVDDKAIGLIIKYLDESIDESSYPSDASRLIFRLLALLCTKTNISFKSIEKLYIKLLRCSYDATEFIKVGEVLAYLLKVYAAYGAAGLKGAEFVLPFNAENEANERTTNDIEDKSYHICIDSFTALQEFVVFWCNVYHQLSIGMYFSMYSTLMDCAAILAIYASLASECSLTTRPMMSICKAIVAVVNDCTDPGVIIYHRDAYVTGLLSW